MTTEKLRTHDANGNVIMENLMKCFDYTGTDNYRAEIEAYAHKRVFDYERVIFYKKRQKDYVMQCTMCGHKEVVSKAPKHLGKTVCPSCLEDVVVKNAKYSTSWVPKYQIIIYFKPHPLDQQILLAHQMCIMQQYTGDIEMEGIWPNYSESTTGYYYFDYKAKNYTIRRGWAGPRITSTVHTMESASTVFWGVAIESLLDAVKDTPFQYALKHMSKHSGYGNNSYNTRHIIPLLDQFSKRPDMEKLIAAGFKDIALATMEGRKNYGCINWNANTVHGMLKLTKGEVRTYGHLIKCSYGTEILKAIQVMNSYKLSQAQIEEGLKMLARVYYNLDYIKVYKYDKPSRINAYLERQMKLNPETYRAINTAMSDLNDTLHDMVALDMDVNKSTMYPKNLNTFHLNLQKQLKAKANELLNAQVMKRANSLEKLSYNNEEFLIRPLYTCDEIINEGDKLRHCVGRYIERFANGKSNLLAVRRVKKPDEPFYTMEVNDKCSFILQCRGKLNKGVHRNSSLEKFIDDFTTERLTKKGKSNDQRAS